MRSKDLLERILWLGGMSQTWDVRSKQHLTETCQWHYAEPWAPNIKVCYDHDQMTQIRNNSTHSQLNTIKYLLSKATMYMYGHTCVLDSNSTFYGTGTRIIMQCMLYTHNVQIYIVSWEPEGCYHYSKMFRWEPEWCYSITIDFVQPRDSPTCSSKRNISECW